MTAKRSAHIPQVHADAVYEENYATRKRVADEGRAALEAAISACGPGADAYGQWIITDKLGEVPARHVFCCRRDGDVRGWQPTDGASRERIEDPALGFTVKGVTYYPFRFSVAFSACTEYAPRTPAQMKAAAEARRDKALAKIAAEQAEREARRAADPQLELGLADPITSDRADRGAP